jgi:histidine phosphotransferase ChpT
VSSIDFASLLCSRLCHDLVGPVGAITNGVELLADETDPDMQRRCLDLVADSARQTANKLKFFRLAFGAAGGFGELVDPREACAALEGLFSSGKVELQWMVGPAGLPKIAVKVLLNLAMTAGDALLRGGTLNVAAEIGASAIELAVRAEGPRVLLDTEIRRALEGQAPADGLGPRTAAGFLVHALVAEYGARVLVSEPDPTTLLLGVTLPRA